MTKTAILLVNLGTPAAPKKIAVRKFLSEFLNDPYVIDLPFIIRKILVNLIIVPFRAGKSTKMYEKIWTENGSPIMFHSIELAKKLNQIEDHEKKYFIAMRYGKPSVDEVLNSIHSEQFKKIVILPLFPQYASSTVETIKNKCNQVFKKLPEICEINYIENFYRHPEFIRIWANRLKLLNCQDFDHILFVFHGLPKRQVEKTHKGCTCEELQCNTQINDKNGLCYKAQCYDNSTLLAAKLGIEQSKYTVCFQSRFGKNWLGPFADKIIETKAKEGIKSLLVVPLSFVADCLETKLEIEIEYSELFKSLGGEKLTMVASLNADNDWVEGLTQICEKY